MDPNIVIKAEGLSKTYYPSSYTALGLKDIFTFSRRKPGHDIKEIRALNDVSFEIRRGDSVGVIGKNGAGKSTLLKVLSGITKPSSGQVMLKGRLQSVLDIDTGFHPDLTGRENVYMKARLMGVKDKETDKHLPEIIEFSGIGQFIDMPVKSYSSGMYMRLAFAFIAYLDADIMLFDEAFSVGDVGFREKVVTRMKELFKLNKTVLVVSHSFSEIMQLCNKLIVLKGGRIVAMGETGEVLGNYIDQLEGFDTQVDENYITNYQDATTYGAVMKANEVPEAELSNLKDQYSWPPDILPGNEHIRLLEVKVLDIEKPGHLRTDEQAKIRVTASISGDAHPFELGIYFMDRFENHLFVSMANCLEKKQWTGGTYDFTCEIPGSLFNRGIIKVGVVLIDENSVIIFKQDSLLRLRFVIEEGREQHKFIGLFPGPIAPPLKWEFEEARVIS